MIIQLGHFKIMLVTKITLIIIQTLALMIEKCVKVTQIKKLLIIRMALIISVQVLIVITEKFMVIIIIMKKRHVKEMLQAMMSLDIICIITIWD